MVQSLTIRLFLVGILSCLLVASVGLPVNRGIADGQDETITPSLTGEAPTEEALLETPAALTENTFATDEPTAVPSVTSTLTATPAPLLQGSYVADQILVRFKNSATEQMIADCMAQIHGEIESTIEEINVTVIKIEGIDVSNAVASLSACPAARYAEPNYLAYVADTIPTDPSWGLQYGLVNIRAPQGWDTATGSSSVTIAIVDTGVDLGHTDLAPKIMPGYDFVNNDTIAQDDNGHGTHVAGIAAAVTNNGSGVAGASWGARILPVKVLNAAGGGTFANVAAGIAWAADNGAQVINLSVGGPSSSSVLQNAIDYAAGQGALIVAAAGNAGINLVLYPAAYPNVIAVGATDSLNNIASFSNYGAEVDLVAPGVSIYSTSPGGYAYRNGTSMATAFVAGFAAILRGIPGNSAGSVRSIMEGTALDLGAAGWDGFYGNGLIQMDSAILLAQPNPPTSNPIRPTALIFGPGGYSFTATFTPGTTPTFTAAIPLTESQTSTLTLQPRENSAGTGTPTPEIIALGTETADRSGTGRNWPIPICGLLLILIGIVLLWSASRRKWRSYSGLHF